MNLFKLVLLNFLALIIASCSFHSGSYSATEVPSNATYEDIGVGVSQSYTLFAIGGVSKDALILEAKKKMYLNKPLKPNQAYANVTVDYKRTLVFIYTQVKVTVTADIIEHQTTTPDKVFSENYQKTLKQGALQADLFHIGDSIVDAGENKGVIISIENPNKVRIITENQKGKFKTKKKSVNRIYTNSTSRNGKNIGEEVKTEDADGTVVYVGINKFLYRVRGGEVFKAKY